MGKVKYQLPVKEQGREIDEFISKICRNEKVSIEELKADRLRKEGGVRFEL